MDPEGEEPPCARLSDCRTSVSGLLDCVRDTINSELNPNPVSANGLIPLLDRFIAIPDRSALLMDEV
jgi:hypothetical protein